MFNNSVIYTIQTALASDLTILAFKKWIRHKLIGFRCNVSYLDLSRLKHSYTLHPGIPCSVNISVSYVSLSKYKKLESQYCLRHNMTSPLHFQMSISRKTWGNYTKISASFCI